MRDRFCSCGPRADIRQLTIGFPKKLLVAISVVIIIAMCLRPAEAASVKKRGLLDNMPKATKDTESPTTHKRRHQNLPRTGTLTTKEHGTMKRSLEQYIKERIKIENKVALTRENFEEKRKALKAEEQGDYGSGMTVWLPKTNFVDIHFHKYGKNLNESTKFKKSFEFLIRKLYKSLLEYYELFKRFQKVTVSSPDNEINKYIERRRDFFSDTANDLYSAIEDIKDGMTCVGMTKWKNINATKSKVDSIELSMDGAKFLKNDDILLRAYGHLLENWHLEFNCSKPRKTKRRVSGRRCMQYDDLLAKKRNKRRKIKKNKHKQRHENSS